MYIYIYMYMEKRENTAIESSDEFPYGSFFKYGDPQVTMGFNTKMI